MNKCPLTYLPCDTLRYHPKGLRRWHRNLTNLEDLAYSAQEQRLEASGRMHRMSIQGVQPKLSATLDIQKLSFELTDIGGQYIIKPQSDHSRCMPENEDVTMRMAAVCGIETPLHGLVWCKDGSLSYVIKRFDRLGKGQKLAVEDFTQLAGLSRETKYDYTTEKMIRLLDQYCTFPALEKLKIFRLLLFCFLTGNEDMHLKNFSLITRKNSTDELALLLAGKRRGFRRRELVEYLGIEKLGLITEAIQDVLDNFHSSFPKWCDLLQSSFLGDDLKAAYQKMIEARMLRLHL